VLGRLDELKILLAEVPVGPLKEDSDLQTLEFSRGMTARDSM
jgi:hypothetical protein